MTARRLNGPPRTAKSLHHDLSTLGIEQGTSVMVHSSLSSIGWVLGAGFAWTMIQSFESELYRVPFIIERATYAHSALIVIGAVILSALIVRRRVNRLDLIEVLKTRE